MDQYVSKFDIIIQYYEELKFIDDLSKLDEQLVDRLSKSINLIANKCMEFYKKLSIGEKFKLKRKRSPESVSDSIIYADLLK